MDNTHWRWTTIQYTDELISALEYWIENNDMVCHSPFKDNLVIKQDWNESIVRDLTTGVPVQVQKMMLMCNLRVLHNHRLNILTVQQRVTTSWYRKQKNKGITQDVVFPHQEDVRSWKKCVDVRIASYSMTCTSASICIRNDTSKEWRETSKGCVMGDWRTICQLS